MSWHTEQLIAAQSSSVLRKRLARRRLPSATTSCAEVIRAADSSSPSPMAVHGPASRATRRDFPAGAVAPIHARQKEVTVDDLVAAQDLFPCRHDPAYHPGNSFYAVPPEPLFEVQLALVIRQCCADGLVTILLLVVVEDGRAAH
jgi:hypothetical protein